MQVCASPRSETQRFGSDTKVLRVLRDHETALPVSALQKIESIELSLHFPFLPATYVLTSALTTANRSPVAHSILFSARSHRHSFHQLTLHRDEPFLRHRCSQQPPCARQPPRLWQLLRHDVRRHSLAQDRTDAPQLPVLALLQRRRHEYPFRSFDRLQSFFQSLPLLLFPAPSDQLFSPAIDADAHTSSHHQTLYRLRSQRSHLLLSSDRRMHHHVTYGRGEARSGAATSSGHQ